MFNDYLTLIPVFDYHRLWPVLSWEGWAGVWLIISFGLLFAVEFHAPHEKLPRQKLKHAYLTNMGLFMFNSVLMSAMSVTSLFILAKHYAGSGLLADMSSPVLKALLSLLALDFVLYVWHRACHRYACFWMFHKVHHSDTALNLSTAFRSHFLEVLLTNVFKAISIVVLGIEEMAVLASEAITTLCIMFHHTNISFKAEKRLGKIMITPYLHRAHHSKRRSEHDNNYGAVLSLWDSLLGTRTEVTPAAIGLSIPMADNVTGLLMAGLSMGYPSAKPAAKPETISIQTTVLEHMIAEAAYYKAEKRGFNPGYDMHDWLEAKKEIMGKMYGGNRTKAKPLRNGIFTYFNQTAKQI